MTKKERKTAKNPITAKLNRNGNIKLGKTIATFSKLYSDEEFITPYGVVKGSCETRFCGGCKGSCYVRKSYRYGTVIKGHARNTLAVRMGALKLYEDIKGQLQRARKPYTMVRVHQSGEFESTEEFLAWCKLANDFPAITFYTYTKAFPYVIPALLCGKVPNNFIINISVWHEYGIKEYNLVKHLQNVKAFIYDDGFNYAAYGIDLNKCDRCMAYDENGKLNHEITCERCGKCLDNNPGHKIIACSDHS